MNLYDVLKAIGQIILPAILTFIGVCGKEFGWDCTDKVITIGTAFITMWNTIIVIWNSNYQKSKETEI